MGDLPSRRAFLAASVAMGLAEALTLLGCNGAGITVLLPIIESVAIEELVRIAVQIGFNFISGGTITHENQFPGFPCRKVPAAPPGFANRDVGNGFCYSHLHP